MGQKTKWLLTDEGLRATVRLPIRASRKEGDNTQNTKRQIVHQILYLECPWHKINFILEMR